MFARIILVMFFVVGVVGAGKALSRQETAEQPDQTSMQLLNRMDSMEQVQKQILQKIDTVLANQQKIIAELDIVKIRATRR